MHRPAGDSDFDSDYDDFDGFVFGDSPIREKSKPIPTPKTANEIARETLKNALIGGDLTKVNEILNANHQIKINEALLPYDGTPLIIACEFAQLEIVRHLLETWNADANVYVNSRTALFAACSSSCVGDQNEATILEIVKLLIKQNVTVNRPCGSLRAIPIMAAIEHGHESVVDYLLTPKLLHVCDANESTILFYAVQFRRPAIVKRLIAMDVNLEITDREGFNPYDLAESLGFDDIMALFPKQEIQHILNEYISYPTHYVDIIPTAFPERMAVSYACDVYGMLKAMKVTNLQFKISDAKIGLPEFLNISDERLQAIGIRYPFQRKRILFGLLKFHRYKFRKELLTIMPPATADKPWPITEYFNVVAKCLKYLIIVQSTLDFVERTDIYQDNVGLNKETKEFVQHIKQFLQEIERQAIIMLKQFKHMEKFIEPPPSLHITKESELLIKRSSIFSKRTVITCALAAGGFWFAQKILRN